MHKTWQDKENISYRNVTSTFYHHPNFGMPDLNRYGFLLKGGSILNAPRLGKALITLCRRTKNILISRGITKASETIHVKRAMLWLELFGGISFVFIELGIWTFIHTHQFFHKFYRDLGKFFISDYPFIIIIIIIIIIDSFVLLLSSLV